jgi:hypothetical protein
MYSKLSRARNLDIVVLDISDISYFSEFRKTSRKIPKPVLKTTFETTFTFDFGIYFVVSFWNHLIWRFSVLLEDSLKIILETLSARKKISRGS